MTKHTRLKCTFGIALTAALVCLWTIGCGKSDSSSGNKANGSASATKQTIQNIGSDTMVNLAQAWAEAYAKVEPSVSVEVAGGGSGIGVAALINGTCDIANCSRKFEPEEVEKAKAKHGH